MRYSHLSASLALVACSPTESQRACRGLAAPQAARSRRPIKTRRSMRSVSRSARNFESSISRPTRSTLVAARLEATACSATSPKVALETYGPRIQMLAQERVDGRRRGAEKGGVRSVGRRAGRAARCRAQRHGRRRHSDHGRHGREPDRGEHRARALSRHAARRHRVRQLRRSRRADLVPADRRHPVLDRRRAEDQGRRQSEARVPVGHGVRRSRLRARSPAAPRSRSRSSCSRSSSAQPLQELRLNLAELALDDRGVVDAHADHQLLPGRQASRAARPRTCRARSAARARSRRAASASASRCSMTSFKRAVNDASGWPSSSYACWNSGSSPR